MKNLFKFDKSLYSKEALLKAAYQFIDEFYIHLDSDEKYYLVEIESKIDKQYLEYKEFENEILIQETRRIVLDKTSNLREIIFSRAMASTIIDLKDNAENNNCDLLVDEDYNTEDILTDWFEKHEE